MSDDRPNVYREWDHVIYRASSFGNCIKELAAIRAGVDPAPFPEKFRKVFADGNRGEDTIISMLEARGFTVTRRQEEINWEILPGVIIRGHIDGVIQYLDEPPAIFDAKTTTAKYGIKPDLQTKYDWQLSIYGHALGLQSSVLGVGIKDPATGDVVTVDTHTADTLAFTVGQIKARVAKIEALAKQVEGAENFDAAVRALKCDTESRYPCGVYFLHDDAEEPVFVRQESTDEILDGLAAEYDAAKQDEAEAKALKEDAKNRLIEHLGGRVDKASGEWQVSWTGTGLRKKLDEKALSKFLAAYGKKVDEFYGTTAVEKSIKVERTNA